MPEVNTRVRLANDVDRYPFFIARKGATGTVVEVDEFLIAVEMDDHLPGAEEWGNAVVWSDDSLVHFRDDVVVDNREEFLRGLNEAHYVEFVELPYWRQIGIADANQGAREMPGHPLAVLAFIDESYNLETERIQEAELDEMLAETFVCDGCGETRPGEPAARHDVRLGDGSVDDRFAFCQRCVDADGDQGAIDLAVAR